jgi:hypothetical protein
MRTILMTRPFQRPLLGCIGLLAGVFALTGGAIASGSPASSRAADNPTQAVRALIHGYYDGPQGQRMPVPGRFANCYPNPLRAAACPVTPRFLHRLQHPDPIPPQHREDRRMNTTRC